MATVNEKMTAIADAIRDKTDDTRRLTLDRMAEDVNKVYEKGKQSEHDRFWDDFFEIMGNTNMSYSFAGRGWNATTFRPDRNLRPITATGMFSNWNTGSPISFKQHFEELGISLDFSRATTVVNVFASNTSITELGIIDFSSATAINSSFSSMSACHTIEKLILMNDGSQTWSNAFSGCAKLENIVIEGVIGKNGFSMSSCKLLSCDSIESVINALSATTSGLSVTLSLDAVNKAFESTTSGNDGSSQNTWMLLAESKPNWNISLI